MKAPCSFIGWCRKAGLLAAALVLGGVSSSSLAAQADGSLNQLFRMDVPSKSAQGEGYVGGQVSYLDFDNDATVLDIRAFAQYGVMPDLVVSLTVPWRRGEIGDNSESELIDVRLGAQYNLRQYINPSMATTAVQLVIGLPTADDKKGLDKGEFEIEPSFLCYKNFGDMGPGQFGLYGQAGVNIASGKQNLILGAGPTYTVYKDWTIVSEIYLACGRVATASSVSDLEWIPGVVYRGLKQWEFAVGIPVGLTSDSPNWGIIAKANWAW